MPKTEITLPDPMSNLTVEKWGEMGTSRAQFAEHWRTRLERDVGAPQIGARAPDLDLEILSSEGGKNYETCRLSSVRGQPAGLIFGSYT